MENVKHAQTPFKRRYRIIDDVGNVCGEVMAENGKRIVRSVNSHDDLVDALRETKMLLKFYEFTIKNNATDGLHQIDVTISKAEQALAKAEGR